MKETGGPAYPEFGNVGYNSDWQNEPGMTLRDYFAAAASNEDILDMQACKGPGMMNRQCARYMCADAMLKEREEE
jgi:hypothetical protein